MLSFDTVKCELLKQLGKGLTSKVFLASAVTDDQQNA